MELFGFGDAGAFLEAVEPALLEREAAHSLLLGSAAALQGSDSGGAYLAAVRDRGGLVAAALLDGARPLLVASDREALGAAAELLARDLADAGRTPAAVHGRERHVAAFARCWTDRSGGTATVVMRQRLHALAEVRRVALPRGALRPAGPDDLELLADWVVAFEREALGDADVPRLRAAAARRLAAGEPYLWVDELPRAMAATARPTRHTISINAVYTPPAERGRGYATGCVALLSERMLAAGRRACVLFTDLANPTSNAIYARIGYQPVADFVLVELDGAGR
ncbi:MAG TPA: GNAT family N-acetyltransferase [Gemmatimonadaceae bacterium]